MTKRKRWFWMAFLKVVGTMMTTLVASITTMGPNQNLSPLQALVITAAVFGNAAINLSGILADAPEDPERLSTGDVRQILGTKKKESP